MFNSCFMPYSSPCALCKDISINMSIAITQATMLLDKSAYQMSGATPGRALDFHQHKP